MHEIIGDPNEDLILIGHSIGCITIMRYLESLKEDQKIGGAVLVAGFIDNLGFEEIKNYFEEPLMDHYVLLNNEDKGVLKETVKDLLMNFD